MVNAGVVLNREPRLELMVAVLKPARRLIRRVTVNDSGDLPDIIPPASPAPPPPKRRASHFDRLPSFSSASHFSMVPMKSVSADRQMNKSSDAVVREVEQASQTSPDTEVNKFGSNR